MHGLSFMEKSSINRGCLDANKKINYKFYQ